jgi:nuclear RNA export factor
MPNQTKLEWKQWLEKSRNLSRVGRSLEKAAKTLFANSNDIVAFVQNLPKTQHDLQGAADKFSLDAWPVDSVLQGGQPVLFLSVHGQFAEGTFSVSRYFFPFLSLFHSTIYGCKEL